MRFKAFNSRYRLLAPSKLLRRTDDKAVDDCRTILDSFSATLLPSIDRQENVSTGWALGKRHIFLT